MSGRPGRLLFRGPSTVNRSPARCSNRLVVSSGAVFFVRMRDISSRRSATERESRPILAIARQIDPNFVA